MKRDIKGTSVCCAWCTVSVCSVCECVYQCVFASRVEIACTCLHVLPIHTTYHIAMCSYISSTIKQDCKAGVKLFLTNDGQHLVVNEVNEEHDHDISEVCQSFISGIIGWHL